jgi:hypothetical protein
LPRGIGIAKPSGHGAHGSQQGVLSEGGIIVAPILVCCGQGAGSEAAKKGSRIGDGLAILGAEPASPS